MTDEAIAAIHPNLKQLSNSSCETLHRCPRKYELSKLTERKEDSDSDFHLKFGKIVGLGVQVYLTTGDLNKAHFAMFRAWKGLIDEEEGEKAKKTFWFALYAVDKFVAVRNSRFGNCVLADLNSRPAVELGFSVDCGDGFFYRGFIDAVLIDKMRNELVVLENKTTSNRNIHEAVYKHSGQSLGYSLILDILAQILHRELDSSYRVFYPVYKSTALEWEVYEFKKTHTQRALWIQNILIDKQTIIDRALSGYFPMHGESCYDFFRPCQFFDTCEMSNKYLVGDKVEVRVEPASKYDYHFSLEELIEAQLARHAEDGG